LAVVVTAVLAVKVPVHAFVRALSREEIMAAVKFGLLALVLLPLLPDLDYGPGDWPWLRDRLRGMGFADQAIAELDLFNPYELWLLVVAISGLGFVGYVVVRVLGPGRGLILTGLAGGLVSSTSVTLAMADQSRRAPEWRRPIAGAVLAACAVMAARVVVVAVALHPGLFLPLALPLGSMMVANLGIALWLSRSEGGAKQEAALPAVTPLAVKPAVKLAALILAVRVVAELAVLAIGYQGLVVTAVLSGIVDVDAINVAASQQAAAGRVATASAAIAICVAVASNTIAKAVMLWTAGDRATGRTGFVALLATLGVGAVGLAVTLLAGLDGREPPR
jgi:uncharacterized membrane protein (DUF4010 family)